MGPNNYNSGEESLALYQHCCTGQGEGDSPLILALETDCVCAQDYNKYCLI